MTWAHVLAASPFLGMFLLVLYVMHVDMKENRRIILRTLAQRGLCTEEDLEECSGGELHLSSFRIAIRQMTDAQEIVRERSSRSTKWTFRLTPKGAKVAAKLPPEDARPPA